MKQENTSLERKTTVATNNSKWRAPKPKSWGLIVLKSNWFNPKVNSLWKESKRNKYPAPRTPLEIIEIFASVSPLLSSFCFIFQTFYLIKLKKKKKKKKKKN